MPVDNSVDKIEQIKGQFSPALLRALWQIDQDRLRLEGDIGKVWKGSPQMKPLGGEEV